MLSNVQSTATVIHDENDPLITEQDVLMLNRLPNTHQLIRQLQGLQSHFNYNYYHNVLDSMHKPDIPENNAILWSNFLDIKNPSVKPDEEFSNDLFSFLQL